MARLDPRKPDARTHARGAPRAGAPEVRAPSAGVARSPNPASVKLSSPVCYASEADDRYMGYLDRGLLVEQLNRLLEAERARDRVGARLAADANDPELRAWAHVIGVDGARWRRMLTGALRTLHAEPSQAAGGHAKAMAICDVEARIGFVIRGQAWIVGELTAILPKVRDDALHANLREMLAAHERNAESAASILERRTASLRTSARPIGSET